jgi:predicted dienelactone hydrolase
VRVPKDAFIAYCDRFPATIDCGWMNAAGVDFAAIDATRYEADLSDGWIGAAVAIDAALRLAMTEESLAAVDLPVLLINLGVPESIPDGMRLDTVADRMPDARYVPIPDTLHFHALAECSAFGRIVIAVAGDDDICSDAGGRPRREVQAELVAAIVPFLEGAVGR